MLQDTSSQYSNEYSGEVVIPQSVKYEGQSYLVTNVASYAFSGCVQVTSVEINASIISSSAFSGCKGVVDLVIGSNVSEIKNNSFENCTSLEKLCILDGNNELLLGYRVIEGTIQTYGLFDTSPLKTIYIGRNLSYEATAGYVGIPPENYKYISSPFCNKTSLTSVTFGNLVTKIGNYFLYGCSNITQITIPNSITRIGAYVFNKCTSLSRVRIEDGTQTLNVGFNSNVYYRGLFYDCPLNTIYIGRNLSYDTQNGSLLKNNTNVKNVTIGRNVTNINVAMFYGCTNIENVIIPESITEIGGSAFYGCSALTDIYFKANPAIASKIPSTAKCHLMLDDSNVADFNTANANTYADASYTRTINEGKYGTIILPFAPDAASLENYAFYEFAEAGDGYMRFEEVTAPAANTPYVYALREGKENIAITGGETTISSSVATPLVDGWETLGSFTNQTIDTSAGYYYALSLEENEINRITNSLTVLPYRAYFQRASAAKSTLSIFIGSGTTGIVELPASEIEGFDEIFDLNGRKVIEPAKGEIYIKNGKKVIF